MKIPFVAPPFAGVLDRLVQLMLAVKRAGHPVPVPTPFPLAQGTAPGLSP